MSDNKIRTFSVAALFEQRDAHRRQEKQADEQLTRRNGEERAAFRERLENVQLTKERIDAVQLRIRRAFERGEAELMFVSFPSDFCSDGGRAIINVAPRQS